MSSLLHRPPSSGILIAAAAVALLTACGTIQVGAEQPAPSTSALSAGAQPAPASAATPSTVASVSRLAAAPKSWNSHVTCVPVITTLSVILGKQKSPEGGATFAGGGFKPGIPNRRSTAPPCSVSGVPTLVELHKVTVGSCAKINRDGDWTCDLKDPAIPASVPADFHAIHIEIDGKFRAKGWAPPIPPGGKLIDVQGFVFWDPDHTKAAFHHHSGWELHSFTAWRLAV